MASYKQELINQLYELEPEQEYENDGEWFGLYRLKNQAGAILFEDAEGTVRGTFYDDEEDLEEAWDSVQDDDEEDDDEDEENEEDDDEEGE